MEKSIAYFLYQKEGDLMYNFNYTHQPKLYLEKIQKTNVENW